MKKSKKKRKVIRAIMVVVIILAIAPFVAPSWSEINCRHQDIDLNTGRAKFTRMIYWIPVHTEIKHTLISMTLGFKDLTSRQGDWQRVNTFSTGMKHSPHYIYHSAFAQINSLSSMWDSRYVQVKFAPGAKKEVAATILKIWKKDGDDEGVNAYIYQLHDLFGDGKLYVTLEDILKLDSKKRE